MANCAKALCDLCECSGDTFCAKRIRHQSRSGSAESTRYAVALAALQVEKDTGRFFFFFVRSSSYGKALGKCESVNLTLQVLSL